MKTKYILLRYSLYECLPHDVSRQIPKECRELAFEIYWVPQTMGEQVWEIFKFDGLKNKEKFIQLLPDHIKLMIDKNMTDERYENWCVDSSPQAKYYLLPENRIDRIK